MPKTFGFETFQEVDERLIEREFGQPKPGSMNGDVQVEKFRVTVEKIEEGKDVYLCRLQKLWENCGDHQQRQPLIDKARELGVELKGEMGEKRIKTSY